MENNVNQPPQENLKQESDAHAQTPENIEDRKETVEKCYDVEGLIIGAVAGVPLIAVMNALMAIQIGMLVGLIVGANIKKK
ncbi:MAG: hypothetical protein FWC85_01555 [Elusimicrobia bacterium]|nr:hypothetical protein [Elusimicrobiota bacterium]